MLQACVLFEPCFFFFQAEDGIRDTSVTGVQTCALPIFQLQVVCRRLWDKLPAAARQIVEADIEAVGDVDSALRSEERRVGKECRSRGAPEYEKKKEREKERKHRYNRMRSANSPALS